MSAFTEEATAIASREAPLAYSTPAKWFHWITAALVAIALPMGFAIGFFEVPDEAVLKADDAAAQAYLAAANAVKYGA